MGSQVFQKIVAWILLEETGKTENQLRADPPVHNVDEGGDTVYGIARAFHPDEPWPPSLDRSLEIYYHEYWLPLSGDSLPPDVAFYVFDMAVNQGLPYAVIKLQEIAGVTMDGRMGPETVDAVKELDSKRVTGFLHAHRSWYYSNRGGPEMDGLLIRLRTLALGTYGKEGVV